MHHAVREPALVEELRLGADVDRRGRRADDLVRRLPEVRVLAIAELADLLD